MDEKLTFKYDRIGGCYTFKNVLPTQNKNRKNSGIKSLLDLTLLPEKSRI